MHEQQSTTPPESPELATGRESAFDQIERNFRYHAPKGNQPARYEVIRSQARALAHAIDANVPAGREKSVALTKLEEVSMWANAGIARNE